MTWGFEVGRVYNRRADIHDRFNGQQRYGIITPADYPLVIIVSGEEGLANGYADVLRDDGVFDYYGEGQVGPMRMWKGNTAIRDHSAKGESLLLFKNDGGPLRFEGEMVYEDHRIEQAPDKNGDMRAAIVFELRFLDTVQEQTEAELDAQEQAQPVDAVDLRNRAYEAAGIRAPRPGGPRNVFKRSADVKRYVLHRAQGHCEGCHDPAPFVRRDLTPYLEPHHIRRVSDGGPDDPRFVISLCPTCHRRVHAGIDGADYNAQLMSMMREIEPPYRR